MKTLPLLFLMAMPPAALADDKPPPAPKRHRGEGRVYEKKISASLVPPKGWEQGKSEGGTYLHFRGPIDEGSPTFNVRTFANPGAPITSIGPGMKKVTTRGLPEWKLAEEGFVVIDGKKAYFMVGKFTSDTGDRKVEMQHLTYLLVAPGRGYTITFLAPAARFEGLRPTFEEAAKSFRGD